MIKKLIDLKTNPIFAALDVLQNTFDDSDPVIRDANFTRSPYQLLSFLVIYAGLNSTNRSYVINKIPTDAGITKQDLDKLIETIDWSTLLKKDAKAALSFDLEVGIARPSLFYQEMQKHCPQLVDVLKSNECVIKVVKSGVVTFTTKVDQAVSWLKPFVRDEVSNYWNVSKFVLSPELEKQISNMAENDSWKCKSFSIKKGSNRVKLLIKAPLNSNEYLSEIKDLEVDPGIYNFFQGMTHFYGLDSVDQVKVKLSNKATFSNEGATASQTQVVSFTCESARFPKEKPKEPTVIVIDGPLNVLYQGIDFMTCLGEQKDNAKASNEVKDVTSYSITLLTKESGISAALYPSKLSSAQVHDINFHPDTIKASLSENNSSNNIDTKAPLSDLSKHNKQTPQTSVSSWQLKFENSVALLLPKIEQFKDNKEAKEAVETLHKLLAMAGQEYFSKPQTQETYKTFKNTCDKEIDAAKKGILANHREWKKLLLAILVTVASLGIAVGINYAREGKITMFSTDSVIRIGKIEENIEKVNPSPKMG